MRELAPKLLRSTRSNADPTPSGSLISCTNRQKWLQWRSMKAKIVTTIQRSAVDQLKPFALPLSLKLYRNTSIAVSISSSL